MLRLTGTTKLQIVLSGAATTSRVTVSYMDFTATATTGGTQLSATNGVTPIDICDSPAALTTRQVDHISLLALAAMTATFSVHDGSARDLFKVTLATGDTFDWAHSGGARVLDANGQVKTGMPGYLPLTGGTLSGALVGAASQDVFNTVSTTVNAFGAASVALNIGHASAAAAFAGGISIPTGKTLSGAGAINISGNITGAAIGGTTLTLNGGLVLSGTPAGLGAGVRYISGAATAEKFYYNAATGGQHLFAIGEVLAGSITANGFNGVFGADAPAAATVTTLTASGAISTTAVDALFSATGATTSSRYISLSNTGGASYFGTENSAGNALGTNTAYDTVIRADVGFAISIGYSAPTIRVASTTAVNMTTSGTTLTVGVGADNGTVSAGVFTDRTKAFEGDALGAIVGIKSKGGHIDHDTLPAFARANVKKTAADGSETIEVERDLGAMISMHSVALQQVSNRLKTIEARLP